MRSFNIPIFYRSPVVTAIKKARSETDKRKVDLKPSIIDLGPLVFKIARHFGFCFGVENAIEIAYKAIEENPEKRIFLLSEMIHNPHVNSDLQERGVRFLMSTSGEQLIPFEDLDSKDIVIVPAFGTTIELFEKLSARGIDPYTYNATCPFVERVWKRAGELGEKGFTIVIHGKHDHEETRATFSHARVSGPSIIIRDHAEAEILASYIDGSKDLSDFDANFSKLTSKDFDPRIHLDKIGVVNQTTMLATETQDIALLLKKSIEKKYGEENSKDHYADTRDTLCYATTENQNAVHGLLKAGGDLALVVGGYNSSNTSHLVEICEKEVPTFYVKDAEEIIDKAKIRHLDLHSNSVIETTGWCPDKKDSPVNILVTAGASCPDALVDAVIAKVAELFGLQDRIGGSVGGES